MWLYGIRVGLATYVLLDTGGALLPGGAPRASKQSQVPWAIWSDFPRPTSRRFRDCIVRPMSRCRNAPPFARLKSLYPVLAAGLAISTPPGMMSALVCRRRGRSGKHGFRLTGTPRCWCGGLPRCASASIARHTAHTLRIKKWYQSCLPVSCLQEGKVVNHDQIWTRESSHPPV